MHSDFMKVAKSGIRLVGLFVLSCLFQMPVDLFAQVSFEEAPINYNKAEPENLITRLQKKMNQGQIKLDYIRDKGFGYLPSVLKSLEIPVSSQVLVFSKTSLQVRHIDPQSPRALYFNDDIYIGYVQGGAVLEVSASDPKLGTVFLYARSISIRQTDLCAKNFSMHAMPCIFTDAGSTRSHHAVCVS